MSPQEKIGPGTTQPEADLLRRLRAGEREAFALVVAQHRQRIAAAIRPMVGPVPELEDLVQETFIRFHQSLDRFRGESRIGTYLIRIAMNLSLNELRRRQVRHWLLPWTDETPEPQAENPNPAQEAEGKSLTSRALDSLSPTHRAVVVLRILEGYSTDEAASILGVPRGTVLSRLARALRELRTQWPLLSGGQHENV